MISTLLVGLALGGSAQVHKLSLVTAAGPIGTFTATTTGNTIDVDWRVDDNGRGSKLKEHIELGAGKLPVKWEIEGRGWVGAPVKESFVVEAGKAKWRSLDDEGEADAKDALYAPNNGSPWAFGLMLDTLLNSKNLEHTLLPAGKVRLEKLRDIPLAPGAKADRATVYALWGWDVSPFFVLQVKGRFAGTIQPGWVLVDEKYTSSFAHLSKLAGDVSAELLERLTQKVAHPITEPLWLTNVRIFDPASGKRGEPTNVVVFNDRVVSVRKDAPPKGAKVADGGGGTLLPGLFDSHAHVSDWGGPLALASGVTFGRDPGNDIDTQLALAQKVGTGRLLGPRSVMSGFIEGKSPFSAHMGFVIDSADEGVDKVRWFADHGYWGIKIYNSMNPDFVAPLAREAHRLGLHVSGHVPAFMSSERAVRDGYDEIHHINQLLLSFIIDVPKDDTRTPFRFTALGERLGKLDLKAEPFQKMLKLMKEKKTTLDPTLEVFSVLLRARPGKASPADEGWLSHAPITVQRARKTAALDVKPEHEELYAASWKKVEEAVVLLQREGVPLVPGTDDIAGLTLLSELETWVKAGISPTAALQAATLGGAKLVGLEGQLGSVAPGKLADLYLVDGDPTTDIGALRKGRLTVKGGAYYYPDELFTAVGVQPFAPHVEVTTQN
ncbi:MAG: amidohydrolase family protein [Myxococcaceae bacterium]|nr:amidohydrolase family protein [Myxococcaceae bacterium]